MRIITSMLVLACVFQLGCRQTSTCDIPKAVTKAQIRDFEQSHPTYELTVGSKGGGHSAPTMLAIEEGDGVLVRHQHLGSGAKLQLLDAQERLLFEDNIPNLEEARARIGDEVLKNGDPAQIQALDKMLAGQTFTVQIPKFTNINKVRVVVDDVESRLNAAVMGTPATPRSYDFRFNDIPRTASVEDLDSLMDQGAQVTAIHYSGNARARLNFIILSDGYRESELELFRQDAEKLKQNLLNKTPFSEYTNYFNIWTVAVPSEESGAICDDNTNHGRRNQFGSIYPVACINAVFKTKFSDRFIIQSKPQRVLKAAKFVRENGHTVPSQIFVLANSRKYGGTAVIWASQNNRSAPDIFTHELGHSFGGLADEYVSAGDPCLFFNLFKPNISLRKTKIANVKWSRWIEPGTPIPTPDTDQFDGKTGLFQGASSCKKMFYRPERTCKMETNFGDFCRICREQIMMRLYDYVRPLNGQLQVYRTTNTARNEFQIQGDVWHWNVETRWYVDGKEAAARPQYSPLITQLAPGKHTIALSVRDASPYIRDDLCHFFEARAIQLDVPK